jgi:hypothetical protein
MDGDLLFSTSKDNKGSVWYSDTGERLGTYGECLEGIISVDYDYLFD